MCKICDAKEIEKQFLVKAEAVAVLKSCCSQKFRKIPRKTPMEEFL